MTTFSCGADFTVAILGNNSTYSCGNNLHHQLGIDKQIVQDKTNVLTLIPALRNVNIMMVSCGLRYTLALSDTGKIYGWGANDGYVLTSNLDDFVKEPTKIKLPNGVKTKYICASPDRSLALDISGKIWVWGDFSQENFFTPTLIESFDKIVQAVIFNDVALAIDQNGDVWEWFWDSISYTSRSIKINLPDYCKAVNVFVSYFTRFILTDTGEIFIWGKIQNSQPHVDTPIKFISNSFFVNITKGLSDCHALDIDGNMIPIIDYDTHTPIIKTNFVEIATGLDFLVCCDSNGLLYSGGHNSSGQLGLSYYSKYEPNFKSIENTKIVRYTKRGGNIKKAMRG